MGMIKFSQLSLKKCQSDTGKLELNVTKKNVIGQVCFLAFVLKLPRMRTVNVKIYTVEI